MLVKVLRTGLSCLALLWLTLVLIDHKVEHPKITVNGVGLVLETNVEVLNSEPIQHSPPLPFFAFGDTCVLGMSRVKKIQEVGDFVTVRLIRQYSTNLRNSTRCPEGTIYAMDAARFWERYDWEYTGGRERHLRWLLKESDQRYEEARQRTQRELEEARQRGSAAMRSSPEKRALIEQVRR